MLERVRDFSTMFGSDAVTTDAAALLPLCLRGVTLEQGGQPLLSDVNLTLGARKITVVMGANGAGKSLLLRIMHGLIKPTSGAVLWGGIPIKQSIIRRQAMVFQRPILLRRSVAANVDFALRLRGRSSQEIRDTLLEEAELLGQASQPARLLSTGEQQRLALARALATQPEILFLDEPTASLDPASTARLEAAAQATHERGIKVIFVTHDIGQAKRMADDVVFLDRGRVLEHSAATSFFRSPSSLSAQNYLSGRLHIPQQ
ncbi:MAG: ATP-binding cassette domain-containing protein [Hyphomicrobiaceae bacterium]